MFRSRSFTSLKIAFSFAGDWLIKIEITWWEVSSTSPSIQSEILLDNIYNFFFSQHQQSVCQKLIRHCWVAPNLTGLPEPFWKWLGQPKRHFFCWCCGKLFKITISQEYAILLPWPKKRTIFEIRGEKNAVPRVISCSISRDQRRAKVADSRGSDLPCADRAWSSMILHVEQRSSRRESRWWFFFLARVVACWGNA